MKHHAIVAIPVSLLLACIGCSSEPSEGSDGSGSNRVNGNGGSSSGVGGGSPIGGGAAVCGLTTGNDGQLVLTASATSNYTFTSSLTLDEILVSPGQNLTFDWSAVTQDFTLHAMSPMADIDMVALIVWKLDRSTLSQKLNDDDLKMSDFSAIAMSYTNNAITSDSLFNFTEFGQPIDQQLLLDYLNPELFDPATHSYTVMAMTGTTPGKGTRMITSFKMDPTADNTSVALDPNSATLDFTVNMSTLQQVSVPVGQANIWIDWSTIATNAMGAEFDPTAIVEVMVGRYSMTVAELENRFLDIDMIADELYVGNVTEGSNFPLSQTFETTTNRAFTGIDATSTWLVALRCGTCTNPAPWYLTVLSPCADGQAQSDQTGQMQTMGASTAADTGGAAGTGAPNP